MLGWGHHIHPLSTPNFCVNLRTEGTKKNWHFLHCYTLQSEIPFFHWNKDDRTTHFHSNQQQFCRNKALAEPKQSLIPTPTPNLSEVERCTPTIPNQWMNILWVFPPVTLTPAFTSHCALNKSDSDLCLVAGQWLFKSYVTVLTLIWILIPIKLNVDALQFQLREKAWRKGHKKIEIFERNKELIELRQEWLHSRFQRSY